jgi:uncharacterized protein with HEPN domain
VLIHHYLGIDLELAWRVATVEIETLKQSVLKIKQDIRSQTGRS